MSTTSRNDLLNRIVTLDLRLSRFDPAPGPEIDPLLDSMNADGSWTGIELVYSPTPRFPAMEHLNRIRRIARSWIDPRSSHYRDPSLPPDVIAGLQLWRKHDPFCTNWWSNDIGVPLALARILAYAQEYLPEDLARWCARRMRRSYRDGFFRIAGSGVGPDGTSPNPDQPATGQNTIWMAQSCLIAASYERDETLAELSIRAILDELVVQPCGKEGIQNDFSFHQHGALL